MKSAHVHSRNYRLLAGLLVAAAVVAILGLKLATAWTATSVPLAAIEQPASTTPALQATPAQSQPTPYLSTEADPYPDKSDPSAQVEWVLRHKKPAMILFHSTLCRPCRMMDALVQMVRRDYEPRVVFIEVITDLPANAELVQQARIGSIPTSFFVSSSGEAKRVIGLMKQADLRAELARLASEE